jgi:hypothetical protein
VSYTSDGQVKELSKPKETRWFNGKGYVMEQAITGKPVKSGGGSFLTTAL